MEDDSEYGDDQRDETEDEDDEGEMKQAANGVAELAVQGSVAR